MNHSKKIILSMTSTLIIGMTTCSFAATGKITGTGVRVREQANTSSNIITNLYKDDEVEVIEKQGEWYKIQYKGKEGYTHQDYIEVIGEINNQKVENEPQNDSNSENKEQQVEPEVEISKEKKIKEDAKIYILPVIYSTVTNTIEKYKVVTINKVINNWSNISAEGINGWIRNEYLIDIQEEEKTSNEYVSKKGYINVSSARVREKATTNSEIITTISRNKEVSIVGEEQDWYKVIVDEKNGYISKELVSDTLTTSRSQETQRTLEQETQPQEENVINGENSSEGETSSVVVTDNEEKVTNTSEMKTSSAGQEVVNYAKQFLEYKYVLGGASPSAGFDCSGLTYYVYKHFGVTLNRRASQQLYNGTKVEKSDLQVGDLIIFNDWDNVEPGHCGIYIGGNQFIHAANPSRGVVTDYMDSRNSYYNARYVEARRIV